MIKNNLGVLSGEIQFQTSEGVILATKSTVELESTHFQK
jgi:hypothetical protein